MMQPFTGDAAKIKDGCHVETFLNMVRWSSAERFPTELAEVTGGAAKTR